MQEVTLLASGVSFCSPNNRQLQKVERNHFELQRMIV